MRRVRSKRKTLEKITVSIRHDVYIYVKESEKNDKREAVCSLCT